MKTYWLSSLMLIACAAAYGNVVINEIDYDQAGTDNSEEFVELYNNGASPIDISGWKLQLLNGNATGNAGTGTAYGTLVIIPASTILPAGGFYVIGDSDMSAAVRDQSFTGTQDLIQNGAADAVVLLNAADVIQDSIVYEGGGSITYTGPAGTWQGTQFMSQDVSFTVPTGRVASEGLSIGRVPDGTNTNNNMADFHVIPRSPKSSNSTKATFALPFTSSFDTLPTGNGIYNLYLDPLIADLPAGTIPVSPDTVSNGKALRVADTSGGGDNSWFGGPGNTGAINVEGFWYLKENVTGGMTYENSGFCLYQTKAQGWYGRTRNTSGAYGYENGISVTYTAGTPAVNAIDVTTDAGKVNADLHISNPDTLTNVASVALAGDKWVPFRAFVDHAGNRLYVNIDNIVIYDGVVPAGTPTAGGVGFGYRQAGGTVGADNGAFFDALTINTNTTVDSSVNDWSVY